MTLTTRTLINFSLFYIGAIFALMVIAIIAGIYFDVSLPSGMGIVTFYVAVIATGGKLGERLSEVPNSGMLWGLAFKITLVSIVISVVLAGALFWLAQTLDPSQAGVFAALGEFSPTVWAIIVLALSVVYLLAGRFVLVTGIKAGMKKRKS